MAFPIHHGKWVGCSNWKAKLVAATEKQISIRTTIMQLDHYLEHLPKFAYFYNHYYTNP